MLTFAGIVMAVRLLQSIKTYLSIFVNFELSGMVTVVRLVQPLNAEPPRISTLSGIVTEVRLVQSQNAELPIEVTPS